MRQSITINGETYSIDDDIIIIEMKGEPAYKNKTGKITSIDDIDQLHGTWGSLAVVPDVDKFKKIDKTDC